MTLLMILTELTICRGDQQAALFFLDEARLLTERGVLLRNRDVALYHYYRWKIGAVDEDERERARAAAHMALERELESFGEAEYRSAFLATRSYGAMARELLERPGQT